MNRTWAAWTAKSAPCDVGIKAQIHYQPNPAPGPACRAMNSPATTQHPEAARLKVLKTNDNQLRMKTIMNDDDGKI
jgi:hypothetical protein